MTRIMDLILSKIKSISALLKVNKWWVYKIGGATFTYLLCKALLVSSNRIIVSKQDIVLLLTFLILILLGYSINDYSDFEKDKIANKSNLFNVVPLKFSLIYISFFFIAFNVVAFAFLNIKLILLFYLLIVLNILYSLKPFRLKEHKYISFIITGIYERALPYFIIIFSLFQEGGTKEKYIVFFVIYILWSFLWECRNFFNGQLTDYKSDLNSNVNSIVVQLGYSKVLQLKRFLMYFEIVALVMWVLLLLKIDYCFLLFFSFVMITPFVHYCTQKDNSVYVSKEKFTFYLYNYSFLASLTVYLFIVKSISLWWALGIIFLFRSRYLKTSYVWVTTQVFYGIKYVLSKIVNHCIYYFRRYILGWSDKKSRGENN